MKKFIQICKTFLLIVNIVFAIAFLFAAFAGKINPNQFPLAYLLVLLFPVFLLMNVLFFIWWLIIKVKWSLVSGIAILISLNSVFHFFAFNIFSKFDSNKSSDNIRIVTWNVAYFGSGGDVRKQMLQQIKSIDADILCMQEFISSTKSGWQHNVQEIAKNNNYPYVFYLPTAKDTQMVIGNIVFSKYPIIDKNESKYPPPSIPDRLFYIDIKKNNSIIRIYTTHLQSNKFSDVEKTRIDDIKEVKDKNISDAKPVVGKLLRTEKMRSIQTDFAKSKIAESPYPTLFCGDCNDVPNSYAYNNIKGSMQDAFIEKGFGIGRTYNAIAPTLRIDYIFADKNFSVQQVKRFTNNLSDHYMLVADVKLKK